MSISRIPLHLQNPDIAKAARDKNPSFETFRPNEIHPVSYKEMEDRPGLGQAYRVRRHPDGTLDYKWLANQIIDAMRQAEYNGVILPVQAALLTVVFPLKYRKMEPQQAEILTKLTPSEKELVRHIVEAHEREVLNYNAGQGGSAIPGMHKPDAGG
jgi:hypothetical protein